MSDWGGLATFPLWYAAFLFSLTCHEAAHAFAAHRGGDDTAYRAGQVSLNPLPHIVREPFGTVLVPILSYLQFGGMMGWASAPFDPYWEDRHPRRAAAMAAAGPAANLVLAAIAFVALSVGLGNGAWLPSTEGLDRLVVAAEGAPAWLDGVGRLLSIGLSLNLLLFLFNLVPVPPLDGAAVVAGLVPSVRGAYRAMRGSWIAAIAGFLVASWAIGNFYVPILVFVLRRLHG